MTRLRDQFERDEPKLDLVTADAIAQRLADHRPARTNGRPAPPDEDHQPRDEGDGDQAATPALPRPARMPWGELPVQPGPVLFVTGEDDEDLIRNRAEALAAGHGWDRTRLLSNFHVFAEGVDLDQSRWQRPLVEITRALRIHLAAFDPVGDLLRPLVTR